MKNLIALVRDHSGSMSYIANDARADYNNTISTIRDASQANSQETFISVVNCGIRDVSVLDDNYRNYHHQHRREISIAEQNVHIKDIKPLSVYPATGRSTPLFASTLEAIKLLENSSVSKGEDVSYLVLVTTDGEENVNPELGQQLAQKIAELQATDLWTFVFRVPRGKSTILAKMGIPVGNIFEWEQTKKGVEVSTQANTTAFTSFFDARSKGITSSRSFYANLEDVSVKEVASQLTEITDPIKILPVSVYDTGKKIREFVEEKIGRKMLKGAAFYQLVKTEDVVQANKLIVIRDKSTNKFYSGAAARQMLALPAVGSIKLSPHNLGAFEVFVQSNSVNRKVLGQVLYWENVGVAYKEGVSS